MENGFATVQGLRAQHQAISDAWDKRAARAWVTGFWLGLMVGLGGAIFAVALTLWMTAR